MDRQLSGEGCGQREEGRGRKTGTGEVPSPLPLSRKGEECPELDPPYENCVAAFRALNEELGRSDPGLRCTVRLRGEQFRSVLGFYGPPRVKLWTGKFLVLQHVLPLWWVCPEKRSRALLGSNPTRDIRVDGAPMACLAPGCPTAAGGILSTPIGHRCHASKIQQRRSNVLREPTAANECRAAHGQHQLLSAVDR